MCCSLILYCQNQYQWIEGNFCFSNIDFNWNDICSPKDRNVKKNKKMTVLINVKSTFKLEWTWISYKQGRLILEEDEKKKDIDFFWLLLCVNVYLLLRCHNCDQTCLVGLKSQKKVGWAQFGSRPTGEYWPAVQAYGVWH